MPLNFIRRLYLPLVLALCAVYAFRPIGPGYDFWAHAAVGRWIVHNGTPPTEGLFLWGSEPTPWIAHSWLCQAFFYALLQLGGGWMPVGNASVGTGPLVVVIFTTTVVCSVFASLWRLWRRCSDVPIPVWTPILFGLAIWVSAPRFQPRQEMLSALFLAVLLSFLVERTNLLAVGNRQSEIGDEANAEARNQTRSPKPETPIVAFVAFVVMFALWVNLHALVALGLAFLWTTAILDALQDRFDTRSRWLLGLAAVCTAATFCNPYGYHYWAAADQLKAGNMANNIEEWKPPWITESLRSYVVIEMSLAALALLAWLRNPNRRWAHAIWVVMMSYLFLKQRRHLWILAIVLLVVLAANANFFDSERAWRWWRRVTKQELEISTSSTRSSGVRGSNEPGGSAISQSAIPLPMRRIAQGGMALIILSWALTAWPKNMNRNGVARGVPEKAAFAIEQGQQRGELPRGRLFNDYSWSSYLQWRLNGTRLPVTSQGANPVYIDLINAYPDGKRGLLQEYFEMLKGSPASMALMKRRGVNLILLPPQFRKDPNVGLFRTLLRRPQEWRTIYSSKLDGTLWARRKLVPIPPRSIIFDGIPPKKAAK